MNSIGYELGKLANMLFRRKPTVSFCITCRNRMWQIKETLPKNLKDNYECRDRVEFVLVDFASTDGLQEWVRDNFQDELKSGYLKYFYTDEMPQWHMSIAKNTAHRLGNNEILVNLDCDNFTGRHGGDYVARIMRKYGPNKVVLHLFTGDYPDGTYGRIAISKENFMAIGGYDEDFDVSSYQDNDLMERAKAFGLRRLRRSKNISAIPNEKGMGITDEETWKGMYERNKARSLSNIAAGRLVVNAGREIGVPAVRMFHE